MGAAVADARARAPQSLLPWLAEPGLLTARVRAACGAATSLRMLRLERAPLDAAAARQARRRGRGLPVARGRDQLRRDVAGSSRSPCFPVSTVGRYPWLRRTRRQRARRVAGARRRRAPRAARVRRARADARARACRLWRQRVEQCSCGRAAPSTGSAAGRFSCRKSSCRPRALRLSLDTRRTP